MRRLYLQVYFTIVASLVLVVITAGLLWHFSTSFPPFGQPVEVAGEIHAELFPPAGVPPRSACSRRSSGWPSASARPWRCSAAATSVWHRRDVGFRLLVAAAKPAAGCDRRADRRSRSRFPTVGGWWHASRRGHAPARSCSRPSSG